MIASDVTMYKNKIMNTLCSSRDIFELINNSKIKTPKQMRDKNIFSYMKIPHTQLDVQNYICFDYNAKKSNANELFKNVTVQLAIICHQSNIFTDYGNRHDVIGGVILDILNWSSILGLELELISDTENILEKEYACRTIVFTNKTLNNFKNGVKDNAHRKA